MGAQRSERRSDGADGVSGRAGHSAGRSAAGARCGGGGPGGAAEEGRRETAAGWGGLRAERAASAAGPNAGMGTAPQQDVIGTQLSAASPRGEVSDGQQIITDGSKREAKGTRLPHGPSDIVYAKIIIFCIAVNKACSWSVNESLPN